MKRQKQSHLGDYYMRIKGESMMIRHYILVIVAILMAACEKKEPIEPLEKSGYPHNYPKHSNPAFTPIEKPNLEEEFYDAPQVP